MLIPDLNFKVLDLRNVDDDFMDAPTDDAIRQLESIEPIDDKWDNFLSATIAEILTRPYT
jgi:hypothetical protein